MCFCNIATATTDEAKNSSSISRGISCYLDRSMCWRADRSRSTTVCFGSLDGQGTLCESCAGISKTSEWSTCQVHTLHCSLCQWHSGNHIKTNITALNSECCSREVNERGEQLWTVAERPTNFRGRCGVVFGAHLQPGRAKHQSTQTICPFDEESQVRDYSVLCAGDVTLREVCVQVVRCTRSLGSAKGVLRLHLR
jgi:hypothetical protein